MVSALNFGSQTASYTPLMPVSFSISASDYHTEGEPFRIVSSGLPDLKGETVLDKRSFAQTSLELEQIRQLLVNEPRGHADMYGGFITEPNDSGADFGVLFWHGDGYSTACGHGTIALGAWAVESGLVASSDDSTTPVTIDVPSGRVRAVVTKSGGQITRITFQNVLSHTVATAVNLSLDDGREVKVDIAYGGANYAILEASQLGLSVEPEHLDELIRLGREIKWALNNSAEAQSQGDSRLNGIYGTIFFDRLQTTDSTIHDRNVTIYADGRVDRSPCGSGTAARIAQLHHLGQMGPDTLLLHDSIVGTRFEGKIATSPAPSAEHGVVPEISGNSWLMAESSFILSDSDPLPSGFSLR